MIRKPICSFFEFYILFILCYTMKGVSMKKKRILSIYLLVLIIAGLISVPIWQQLEKTTSIAFSEKKRTVKVPT